MNFPSIDHLFAQCFVAHPPAFDSGAIPAPDINQARAFTDALGGGVFDYRAIHDRDRGLQAVNFRGTIDEVWPQLLTYNTAGYGCFAVVNECDGQGQSTANVTRIRAHYIDLDNLSAMQNLQRANEWSIKPAFMVQSSEQKAHVYWPVVAYQDNERFTAIQRKLIQFFDGDPVIFDAPRVLRMPGTLHQKGAPQLVTCSALSGYGYTTPVEYFEQALAHVDVAVGAGERHPLGDPEKAAPSLAWLQYALDQQDPNDLDRGEWIGFTAAIKQSGWSLTDPDTLYQMWAAWCAKYSQDDPNENRKQWDSIKDAQLGWNSIKSRVPAVKAHATFSGVTQQAIPAPVEGQISAPPMPVPEPPAMDGTGELMTAPEQAVYFEGCVLIGPRNRIMNGRGIIYDPGGFNSMFGGKKFIIDDFAKITDEPWKAATRSTQWTIPKVDGTRFLPLEEPGKITIDNAGLSAVNTYFPVTIPRQQGDVTPFLNHIAKILPVESDREILLDYLAHNVKFPGHKIPWAPLLQSAEGVGKNVFKNVLRHAIDKRYFYQPKAKQLNESGSKFNGWMEGKLFFLVDEIRTDEKRDMVETLKPFITEIELEIEGKGSNQVMGDTPGNWMFFSNHKDAIPINKNGRRFSINYSVLQTHEDILAAGMNDQYFNNLYNWLGGNENGGHRRGLMYVTDYLMARPITLGGLPSRAPWTSSFDEALRESRGWLEQMIMEAVEDGLDGFRSGWVSTKALSNILFDNRKNVATKTIAKALGDLGYHKIGRAKSGPDRDSYLWSTNPNQNISNYFPSQMFL
jgi:hypothetical protein